MYHVFYGSLPHLTFLLGLICRLILLLWLTFHYLGKDRAENEKWFPFLKRKYQLQIDRAKNKLATKIFIFLATALWSLVLVLGLLEVGSSTFTYFQLQSYQITTYADGQLYDIEVRKEGSMSSSATIEGTFRLRNHSYRIHFIDANKRLANQFLDQDKELFDVTVGLTADNILYSIEEFLE